MTEIIFEVTEDEVDGGYSASAIGYGIHTQGDSLEEVRSNVREAVDCYFDSTMPRPKLKLTYAVVHEQTPDNYCAYVPELPGCIGTGKTWDEVQRTMQEAIELHLEGILECGLPLPEPRMSLKEAEAQHNRPLTEEERESLVPFPDSQSTLPTTYRTVEVEVGVSSRTAGGS